MPVHNYPNLRRGLLVARALGNAKRVSTVFMLEGREMTEAELAHFHGISPPAMSRHLHILLKTGILESERRHGAVFFLAFAKVQEGVACFEKGVMDRCKDVIS